MKVTPLHRYAGIAILGALSLTACSSSNGASTTSGSTSTSGAGNAYCASGSLSGQGSTFQQNAELQWIADYQKACSGSTVAYQGTGSGAGKGALGNGTADFGGTDTLPKAEEQAAADKTCSPGKGIVTPIVAGAAVLTFHVKGVDKLTLDAATTAKIFTKAITKWDDPAIAALNSGVKLPSESIVPVVRSDKSGTTSIFSTWMKTNAPDVFTLEPGEAVTWPSGVQTGKGSDGVTTAVAQAEGGITYTELSFAAPKKLSVASVVNPAGKTVEPTADSVSAALKTAKTDTSQGDLRVTPDFATTDPAAYPLASPTNIFTCDKGNKNAALLKGFFTYALTDGKGVLADLGYAPLPDELNKKALDQIATFS